MNKTEEILLIADEIQDESHEYARQIIKIKPDVSDYSVLTDLFVFKKLAELQYEINQLKNNYENK